MSFQRIKTLNVLCSRTLQVDGELISTFLSFEPTDIEQDLAGGPTVTNVTILPQFNKAVLQGIVPVQTTITTGTVGTVVDVNIPFLAELECPGITHTAHVQIHDAQAALVDPFVFRAVSIPAAEFEEFQIRLRAIVRLCVVVSQETIMKTAADLQFC